jgi:pentatricopeptide repeat protein
MKKFHQATLLALLATSCNGFSASNNQRRPKKDFSAQIVEEVIVKSVTPKVQNTFSSNPNKRSMKNNKRPRRPNPNQRDNSISQRDPIISLNMNLDYLAKSGQRDAAIRAEEMLQRIEALHDDGYYEKSPDVCSYNSVINAYAHGKVSGASGHAHRLMKRMEEKGIEPNSITWNTLLRCLLKEVKETTNTEVSEEKVEDAESIITNMEDLGLANTISYNTVISILSKSKLPDAAERSEVWLNRMIDQFAKTGDDTIQPDTCSFNSVIHAYANTNRFSAGAPQRAKMAENIINRMERSYQSGENDQVKPDVVSYSAVINAYAKAAEFDKDCATKAMDILNRMVKMYEGGDKDVKPNKRTYTSVINAFARTGEAEAADNLLTQMKEYYALGDTSLKPDTVCYSSVIDGYAKEGGEEAAFRAEELLHEMEDLYNQGDMDVKPNTRTYRSAITALGKSRQPRAAEKAEQILEEMEYMGSFGAHDLAPNTICYNAVIDAYARGRSIGKAYRAELLLEKMLEESEKGNTLIRPDTITFNSVINAAARSFGDAVVRREAYLIGLGAFKKIHEYEHCKPSSITYVLFLNVLKNLVEEGDARDNMAERTFQLSVSLGLANGKVREQVRKT